MPTIEQNLEKWDDDHNWIDEGDEWSTSWGGTENLWWWVLYPRIINFLKVKTILEIAPGHGRITKYLKNYCEKLIVVDLSPKCIEACKKKFSNDKNIEYYVNDGKSLDMLKDSSIDFVISFDSMVHVEKEVLKSYLTQLRKKMTPNGIGFIHHSNLAMYSHIGNKYLSFKPPFFVRKHWRARTMSSKLFKNYCEKEGLNCLSQELINWGCKHLNDTFSIFTVKDSKFNKTYTEIKNYDFMKMADYARRISKVYNLSGPNNF